MKKPFKNLGLTFDRSFSRGVGKQIVWLLVIMLLMFGLLLALSSLRVFYAPGAEGSRGRVWDVLFLLFDPGTLNDSLRSPFALIVALVGVTIFSGMLISVISNVLQRRVERYQAGETSYKFRNHRVVLGYNSSVPSLLRKIHREDPESTIVLMCDRDVMDIRDRIHACLETKERYDVEDSLVVLNGMRNAVDDLGRLCMDKNPKEVYILGEENESAHDSISMECLEMLSKAMPEKNRIKCHVQFDSKMMYSILQSVDIDAKIKEKFEFLPFNVNEIWAQKAFATIPEQTVKIGDVAQDWTYDSLDGAGIPANSKKHVHLVVVGMNDMGTTMAENAAHILHFPNFKEGVFDTCSHISFIDTCAKKKGREFRAFHHTLFDLARWRSVNVNECLDEEHYWKDPMTDADSLSPYKTLLGPVNFMDIQWEFIEAEIDDDNIVEYLRRHATCDDELLTIALCHDDSVWNTSAVLSFSEDIIQGTHQILVRSKESPAMVNLLRKRTGYDNVKPFGILSECLFDEVIHEEYGKIVNACYHDENGEISFDNIAESKEEINRKWANCTIAEKWSSIFSANMLYSKLRFLGLDTTEELESNTIALAVKTYEDDLRRTEHNRWNTERILMGVRPLNSVKEKTEWKLADDYKRKRMKVTKHLDIMRNDDLKEADLEVVIKDNDMKVNSRLAELYGLVKHLR